MADQNIKAKTALAEAPADADLLYIADMSENSGSGADKKIEYQHLILPLNYHNKPQITEIKGRGLKTSLQQTITVNGFNFPHNIAAADISFSGTGTGSITVNSVAFVNPTQITVTLTTDANEKQYNMTLNSRAGNVTFNNAVNVTATTWLSLLSGGDSLTTGSHATIGTDTLDVQHRSGITVSRDANGMSFSGLSPWSSWVLFNKLKFQDGDDSITEFIFNNPTAAMMIGIGSDGITANSSGQYYQHEVLAYFQNATRFYGIYGNSGTPGNGASLAQITDILTGKDFKLKITQDGNKAKNGKAAGKVELFQMDAIATEANRDNEDNKLVSVTIAGSFNPSQTNRFPSIVPVSGGAQRFKYVRNLQP